MMTEQHGLWLVLGGYRKVQITWAIVVIDFLRISLDIEEEGLGCWDS